LEVINGPFRRLLSRSVPEVHEYRLPNRDIDRKPAVDRWIILTEFGVRGVAIEGRSQCPGRRLRKALGDIRTTQFRRVDIDQLGPTLVDIDDFAVGPRLDHADRCRVDVV
jgi:hypothetical protein